jgi:hypothetical protein
MSTVSRCPICKKGQTGYLQTDIRRMNEHLKTHGAAPLSRQEFDQLVRVHASKKGRSYVEPQDESEEEQGDFRCESHFECQVGLLKSSLIFQDGECIAAMESDLFFNLEGTSVHKGINPFFQGVKDLFERAAALCGRAGSTLVRQQAQRNCEAKVTSKVFSIVTKKTCDRYAKRVAHFVYFCSKLNWDVDGRSFMNNNATDILMAVLFEKHRTISQTFVARCEMCW